MPRYIFIYIYKYQNISKWGASLGGRLGYYFLDRACLYMKCASVAQWAKALLWWRPRSPGLTAADRLWSWDWAQAVCVKVCQLLVVCRWFPPGALVSSTNETDISLSSSSSPPRYEPGCCWGVKPTKLMGSETPSMQADSISPWLGNRSSDGVRTAL